VPSLRPAPPRLFTAGAPVAEARTRWLWVASVVTLAGVFAAARVADEPGLPVRGARHADRDAGLPGGERGGRPRGGSVEAPVTAIGEVERPSFDAALAERLAQAWEPPAPPPPTRAERAAQKAARATGAAQPQAPALPFRVIGRFSDGASDAAIVQSGQAVHVLRRGDMVERNYRVEDVNEKEVTLMYLPLNISQKLDLGAAR